MSEYQGQPIENEFNSVDCGSVRLIYNEVLLSSLLDIPVNNHEASIAQCSILAAPHFSGPISKHIDNAVFGIRKYNTTESVAKGHIKYYVSKTNPQRKYYGLNWILKNLCEHFESQMFFSDFNFSFDGTKIVAENELHTFLFTMTNNPRAADAVILNIESQPDSETLMTPDGIIVAGQAWAYMIDYVMHLGISNYGRISSELTTAVTFGDLIEVPSDIEIALLQELDTRHEALGANGTLPNFDNADILSDDIQRIATGHSLTPDEIVDISKKIIDKKRTEYALLDIATDINQGDIIEALRKVLEGRDREA